MAVMILCQHCKYCKYDLGQQHNNFQRKPQIARMAEYSIGNVTLNISTFMNQIVMEIDMELELKLEVEPKLHWLIEMRFS